MKSKLVKSKKLMIMLVSIALWGFGCSSENSSTKENVTANKASTTEKVGEHGVGPVATVDLAAVLDQGLVQTGENIFESKCMACHKFDERYVGPSLGGVTERRNPAWIMNMIINPQEMTEKDPVAKQLLAEYMTAMPNQNVTKEDARALLEYFRSLDKENSNL